MDFMLLSLSINVFEFEVCLSVCLSTCLQVNVCGVVWCGAVWCVDEHSL